MRKCRVIVSGAECGLESRLESLKSESLKSSSDMSGTAGERYLSATPKPIAIYVCPLGHKSEEPSLYQRTPGVTVYRKSLGNGETWHICSNCSSWPDSDFIDQTTVPSTGEMCNECQAKRRAGNCR